MAHQARICTSCNTPVAHGVLCPACGQRTSSPCDHCGEPLEAEDSFCPACGHKTTVFCAGCGCPLEAEDAFCPACGAKRDDALAAETKGEPPRARAQPIPAPVARQPEVKEETRVRESLQRQASAPRLPSVDRADARGLRAILLWGMAWALAGLLFKLSHEYFNRWIHVRFWVDGFDLLSRALVAALPWGAYWLAGGLLAGFGTAKALPPGYRAAPWGALAGTALGLFLFLMLYYWLRRKAVWFLPFSLLVSELLLIALMAAVAAAAGAWVVKRMAHTATETVPVRLPWATLGWGGGVALALLLQLIFIYF